MTLVRLDKTLGAMLQRPYLTSASGALLRNPRGGVEDVAEMAAAGMKWLAFNVGDGQHWDDWRIVRERARDANVEVLPWARCRTLADCHDLLETADVFASKCLLNIEDEFKDVLPPFRVAELLSDYTMQSRGLDVGISTVGWVYNSVDYLPLANYPALLQLFPTDMRLDPADLEEIQAQCVAHARDKGFTYVGVTIQAYGGAKPEWYGYIDGTFSIFAGDDVGSSNWAAWGA